MRRIPESVQFKRCRPSAWKVHAERFPVGTCARLNMQIHFILWHLRADFPDRLIGHDQQII